MERFLRKQREILVVIAYVLVVALTAYFAIFPLLKKINDVSDKIQEENLNQEVTRQHLNEVPKMQQQYEILEKEGELLDVLLDKNNAVPLIEKLEKLAQDSQNKIVITVQEQAVSVQKNANRATKKKAEEEAKIIDLLPSTDYLQMKISLTGSYGSIVNFVDALENFEYYSDIIAMEIMQIDPRNNAQANNASKDPFYNKVEKTAIEKEPEILDSAEAFIDVVFYTKK